MAFNIAGAMQYAQPVTSFQQGRAMRLANATGEQNLRLGAQAEELNALELDAARNPQPTPEELRARESHQIKRAQEFMTAGRELHATTYALYEELVKGGRSKEDAQVAAQAVWDKNRRMVAETFGKDFAVQLDDDGVWTPEESLAGMKQADDMLKQLQGEGADSGFTLSPGQTRFDADGKPVASVADAPAPGDAFDTASKLRTEFNAQTSNFRLASDGYRSVLAASKNPSAAGDIALIFSFMKTLDPNSSVREGEYASAQNATGVPGRIRAQYNNILSGERLSPDQRQDFVSQATNLYNGQRQGYDALSKKYTELATRAGVSPEDVIGISLAVEPPGDDDINALLDQYAPR
jgi:hypothetical protein